MNTFRRIALLLTLLLAVLPAHAQTTRKKTTRKKAVATKVAKKKPTAKGKKKAPPADDTSPSDTGDVASPQPMVFGEPDDSAAPSDTPKAPESRPALATPAKAPPPASTPPVKPDGRPSLANSAVAPSAGSGPVALFSVPRSAGAAEAAVRLETELRNHLQRGGDVPFVDLGLAFPPSEPLPLTKADGLFEEGRSAYDNLDPETAEARFREAAAAYEKAPGDLRPQRLSETYLFLGASRMLNGDTAGAKESFLRSVVADASTRPDKALFGQDVQKAFDDARAEVAAQPAGTLVVDSLPAGAQVRVRGEDVGVTPLKGVSVAPGRHPVVVSLPGHTSYAQLAEVKPAGSTEVKATLEPGPGLSAIREAAVRAGSQAAFESETLPPETAAIADRLDARYLVLAAVSQDKKGRFAAELQVWDVRTQARLRGVEIDLSGKERDQSPAATAEKVRGFINGAMAPRVAESTGSGESLLKRPWFWAVVGGVAAVTAGAVYVVTQDNGRPFNPVSGGVGF
ncbi:PEGA domain-containing protein [Myxococcus landrumensis]|uniref:PEGA domain-containing protein n=1 Tax=Myxococcus landrumensis TaxID=2813577 RepID=A0ABX7NED4_9BACT|nr:PEGA domain-containing protein [Myxococcus landrumus]QSQ16734.1 PEGA domain-containing protein [Myxococcus landrumus]